MNGSGFALNADVTFSKLKLLPLKSEVDLVISWTVMTVDLETTAVSRKEERKNLLHFFFIDTECCWCK